MHQQTHVITILKIPTILNIVGWLTMTATDIQEQRIENSYKAYNS